MTGKKTNQYRVFACLLFLLLLLVGGDRLLRGRSPEKTQLVPNVHEFSGHIACDSASNSEIVVPFFKDGEVFGVLDIDSPSLARFSEEDREGFEALACVLETYLFR